MGKLWHLLCVKPWYSIMFPLFDLSAWLLSGCGLGPGVNLIAYNINSDWLVSELF